MPTVSALPIYQVADDVAKRPHTIKTNLPTYQKDRRQWRRKILSKVLTAAKRSGVVYCKQDSLEVVVLLYLKKGKRLAIHDVDNRLKDILDALQGRFGSDRTKKRLLQNDNQVCRVVMEKQPIPKKFRDNAGGRILIRPYEKRPWPLQMTKHDSSIGTLKKTAR